MQKILIATTNPGKFEEFATEFKDLPFTFVSLKDLGLNKIILEEPYNTTHENAYHKAEFFAKKSKLITIAEDSGVFVNHLGGKPGVKVKKSGSTERERLNYILEPLQGMPQTKRKISFEVTGCIYNPKNNEAHLFRGAAHGIVPTKLNSTWRPGVEHDAIFYHPPSKKLFSEMSLPEKNLVSHRGQIISQIRIFLAKQYGFKQIIVPGGLIIQNRRLLLLQRRDSRAEFNNKWEFPGGGVENGEDVERCLKRECLEETGFSISIIERLPAIYTKVEHRWNYQVFLIIYICAITGGKLKTMDNETSGHAWCTYEEAIKKDSLDLNKKIIKNNKTIIKKYID